MRSGATESVWVELDEYTVGPRGDGETTSVAGSPDPLESRWKALQSQGMYRAQKFVENHIKIGIDSLKQLINNGLTVRHLRF